jgi:hypothetical protein
MMERDDAKLNGDSCNPPNPNVRYVVIYGITLLRSVPHPPALPVARNAANQVRFIS